MTVATSTILPNVGAAPGTGTGEPAKVKKKKKSKEKVEQKKPKIVVEYRGVIDEERVERVSNTMDGLLSQFTTGCTKLADKHLGMIKRRKLENDTLICIEKMRDLMYDTVKGDKRELDCVFGGNCIRIGKVFYQMDLTENWNPEQEEEDEGSSCAMSTASSTAISTNVDATTSLSSSSSGTSSSASMTASPGRSSVQTETGTEQAALLEAGRSSAGGSSSSTSSSRGSCSSSSSYHCKNTTEKIITSSAKQNNINPVTSLIEEPRWQDLRKAAASVKAVLESMGHYRQWRPDQEESEESSTDEDELTEEEKFARWVRKLEKIKNQPQDQKRVLDDFKKIDQITTIEECLNIKVDAKWQFTNWMIWMVHRVFLNDPTLLELSFAGTQMPPPENEFRVAPKLCAAVGKNRFLERLYLQNSTLQSGEAEVLGKSLRDNGSLRELNIEGNYVDVSALCTIADSLSVNRSLEVLRISGQQGECMNNRGMGAKFEEILGSAMLKNQSLISVGIALYNPSWRDVLDRALTRNNDRKKRMERRKNGVPSVSTASTSACSSMYGGVIPTTSSSEAQIIPPPSRNLSTASSIVSKDSDAGEQGQHTRADNDGKHSGPSVSAFRDKIEGRNTRQEANLQPAKMGGELSDGDLQQASKGEQTTATPGEEEQDEEEDEIEIVPPAPQQSISWLVTDENGEGRIASATLPLPAEDGTAAGQEEEEHEDAEEGEIIANYGETAAEGQDGIFPVANQEEKTPSKTVGE
ncbi:unnamed protein product [Amoebophrya sp. A120]|nr:unnamed protein product [Amoebophrya sp. A120]|eukprot:GSA120T00019058001.1